MKKIILSALLASVVLSAADYPYEVTPMIGYAFPNEGQQLRDHTVFAAEMQFNNFGAALKPELSVIYSDTDRNDEGPGDIDIFRSALNGVYEFQKHNRIVPLIKAGIGYETMSDHLYENQNGLFVDAGVGVKIALLSQIALKVEAIEMQKYNHSNWDNNLLFMAGLNYVFGE